MGGLGVEMRVKRVEFGAEMGAEVGFLVDEMAASG